MTYKIGNTAFLLKNNYKTGQTLKIRNDFEINNWPKEGCLLAIEENGQLLAKYEVKQVDKNYIYGIVTNTYGHKRRK